MNAGVFVDTNILVYARDTTEPAKLSIAQDWLHRLWMEQRGRTSMQVLSEYYVTVTRKLSPGLQQDDAWEDVETFLAWEPQAIDRDVLTRAREIERRYSLSWWDSMIVAAAELQRCDLLLSEDLQHGQVYGSVKIWNPFREGVAEESVPHGAAPKPQSRHRPPGRPRVRRRE
jgi:predicted nucleic acid-binding protein